uniref:Histone deacetylase n=1 Tax=Meloidogyne incognita TaxID=6306 RepID=A0A914LQD9_MELIC
MTNKNSICYYHHPDLGNFHYGAQHPMKPARLGFLMIFLFFDRYLKLSAIFLKLSANLKMSANFIRKIFFIIGRTF